LAQPGIDTKRVTPSEPPWCGWGRAQLRQRLQRVEQDIERLRQHNEQLRQRNEELQQQVEEFQEELGDKNKAIADRDQQIADLERQLAARKRNSTNSSKPPSSDGLAGTQRRHCSPRKKSGRKPGGQPGHMGHDRQPVEKPDRIEEVLPQACKHCGTALPQARAERPTVEDVSRRQIVDLPERIVPVVTEYQYPKLVCPCCQKGTRAELQPEHQHEIGERLTAAIGYLIGARKMTRRDVAATLQDLLGVDISVGSVQKAWEEAADAVAEPYTELEQALPNEPVLNSDETGSRTNGEKRWVWVLCAPWFVFFYIASSRGVEVLMQLLGKAFAGILCSDRCPTYLSYHRGLAQFCWAHLQRTLKGIGEYAATPDAVHFARDMLAAVGRLFALWYRFRGEAGPDQNLLTRGELIQQSIPIQKQICRLAEKYLDSQDREVRNFASAVYGHWDKLFTFLEHEGVEPTNNFSERVLRLFVLIRKITYGNRSAKGEIALARLLTVIQTCKLQQRPLLAYLLTAVHCHRRRQPAPSLRPLQNQ
jgi:DivIVA protein./Transposase IS66 family.